MDIVQIKRSKYTELHFNELTTRLANQLIKYVL